MIPNYYNMEINDLLNEIKMSRKEYEVPDYFIERFNKKMHEAIKNDIREISIPIRKNIFDRDNNRLINLGNAIQNKLKQKYNNHNEFNIYHSKVYHTIDISWYNL